jgi:hypothetical protein
VACDCDGVCPESEHCIAIYLLDEEPGDDARCIVLCSEDELVASKPQKVASGRRIDISMRNVDRVKLGSFLASLVDEDVLIPAKSATEIVEVSEKDTTLDVVIERAGLVVGPRAAPPSAG